MMQKKLPAVEVVIILALVALVGSLTPRLLRQNLNLAEAISKEYDSVGKTYGGVAERPQDATKLIIETREKMIGESKLPPDFGIRVESDEDLKDKGERLASNTLWVSDTMARAVSSAASAEDKVGAFVDTFVRSFEAYGIDKTTAIELTEKVFDKYDKNQEVENLGFTYGDASAALNR